MSHHHHRHPFQAANALTFDELQSLSYKEVKGTGLANVCPVVATDGAVDGKGIKSGNYKLERFCMEPTEFTVKEESQFKGGQAEFVPTKLMTRLTYSLDGMEGTFSVDGSGNVALVEKEGLDFAPVTVQLPGGERVPFLFTVKELNAKGKAEAFEGQFVVPAYRGSSFLDPKVRARRLFWLCKLHLHSITAQGRGGSTGYDNAVALPARSDADEFLKENVKVLTPDTGKIKMKVAAYNPKTGEIGGVFESIQPSDTDLGSKEPKDVKTVGLWYAQLS